MDTTFTQLQYDMISPQIIRESRLSDCLCSVSTHDPSQSTNMHSEYNVLSQTTSICLCIREQRNGSNGIVLKHSLGLRYSALV